MILHGGLVACSGGEAVSTREVSSTADARAVGDVDPSCTSGRRVLVNDVLNARDLGGTELSGGTVACGRLFRGAGLGALSAQGCEELHTLGLQTVIDLRMAEERAAFPDAPCAQVATRMVLAPMPIPYNLSPADYLADLATAPALRAVFEVLGHATSYPVYVHCTYGRDRTGVIAALVLLALGASRATVEAEYERSAAAGLVIAPASLGAVLDAIEEAGGVDAYLLALGVEAPGLATLRARAILARP